MLFGRVPKWKVSLSLCWHCFNICTTQLNTSQLCCLSGFEASSFSPEREEINFQFQTKFQGGAKQIKGGAKKIEGGTKQSLVFLSRKGGSLDRWAGTSRMVSLSHNHVLQLICAKSSTGRTSRRATSSWWTTSTTSTPSGESLGRLSSTCLARCLKGGSAEMTQTMSMSGPVRWSSDWRLRQAAVVHFHLRLVQPRPAHRWLQVLWGLRHPGLSQLGGVHGVHLLSAPPGHTKESWVCLYIIFSSCRTFLRCLVCTPTQTSPTRSTRQQGSLTKSWRCSQRTQLEVARVRAGRGRWRDWQKTCSGCPPCPPCLHFCVYQETSGRLLTTWGEGGHWGVGWDAADEHLPQVDCLLVQSWKPIYVLFPDKRLTGCKGCWAFCAAPWPIWWWRLRERSSWATTSKKFSTTCLMQRWKTPQIF